MPELPEVETVRRTLEPRVVGRRIVRVEVREPRLRRRIDPDFARRLPGHTISAVERAGKYLLFRLDGAAVWVVHLGMSGCLAAGTASGARHNHVDVALSDGTVLSYNDPRRFGLMTLSAPPPPEIASLGVDPLSPEFTVQYLRDHCRGRRRPIKNLLMDQRVVAGLGNIYVNEILFAAGVRPSRRSGRLRRAETEAIVAATGEVLREAISLGGSSISDYRDGEGRPGYFQLRLRVYDRRGEPCPQCRTAIGSRVLAGRSSFYCPRCQR